MSLIVNEPVEKYAEERIDAGFRALPAARGGDARDANAPQMMVGLLEGPFLGSSSGRRRRSGSSSSARSRAGRRSRWRSGLAGGRPSHDLRRQRGHDRDRAPLCGGSRRRRPHRVPARSRRSRRSTSLDGPFDLIFIDADKENYVNYYEAVLPKLADDGFVIADNVLWSATSRRPEDGDGNTQAIRAFNDHVAGRRPRRMRDAQRARRDDADPQEVTLSTVRSSSESSTTVGERERLLVRREEAVRDRHDGHSGGVRRADAVVRVLDRRAVVGRDAEPARRLEVDVRRRLAASDLLRGDRDPKRTGQPRRVEDEVDDRPVGRGREAKRPAGGEPSTASRAPGSRGRCSR